MIRPTTIDEAVAAIRENVAAGHALRPRGAGTKLEWGGRDAGGSANGESAAPLVDLDTRGMSRILEHNAGDFTAVLEAGVPLATAQAAFAEAGQMLALDPPLGADSTATIGGILAANDSGPLRHRYGGMRDLVLGVTVVLSDGTVASAGGKVIKNVAGYDIAKLFTGSFGTLGLVVKLAVRLHPAIKTSATAIGETDDPERLSAVARALARLPIEADCMDVAWAGGAGRLLVRFTGAAADERARAAAAQMTGLESVRVATDDAEIWDRQRAAQRAPQAMEPGVNGGGRAGAVVVKVAGLPTDLAELLRAAEAAGGSVVSRAALGLSWVTLPGAAEAEAFRRAFRHRATTVLDGASRVTNPWPEIRPGVLALMRRVKARFDPARAFRPGIFVGGI